MSDLVIDQEYLEKRQALVDRYTLKIYSPSYQEEDFKDILRFLEEQGGFSDVYFSTGERIRIKVSGFHFPISKRELDREEVLRFVKLIAGESAPTLLNSAKDLDPSWFIPKNEAVVDVYRYRVNLSKGLTEEGDGYHAVLRALKEDIPTVEFVGLTQAMALDMIPRQGLGLLCGTTGSGKSTTIASVISLHLNRPGDRHFITYEAPIEYVHKTKHLEFNSIVQTEIGDIGGHLRTMPLGVRNSLRRNGDVVFIGETRDLDTASSALQAANTGQFCLTTMHCNSIAETLERFMSFYADPSMRKQQMIVFFKQIKWIMCQFLVKGVNRPLIPVREYMFFTEQDRNALINYDGPDIAGFVNQLIRNSPKGQLMAEHATELYEAGEIVHTEYLYVMSGVS